LSQKGFLMLIKNALAMVLLGLMVMVAADAEVPKSARTSQYSDTINSGACVSENDAWRCYSPQGKKAWTLDFDDAGNVIFLAVRHAATPQKGLVLEGLSVGEKVEWRGLHKAGVFQADALIVRMRPTSDSGNVSYNFLELLWVVKLSKAGSCLVAVVDAKANKEPNVLARAAADKLPDVCPAKPRISGVSSPEVLEAVEQTQH
jgi:hypothetical protein